jgi:hypothetical protein
MATWEWDEAKYKLSSPLKDVIDAVSTVRQDPHHGSVVVVVVPVLACPCFSGQH